MTLSDRCQVDMLKRTLIGIQLDMVLFMQIIDSIYGLLNKYIKMGSDGLGLVAVCSRDYFVMFVHTLFDFV
jgi:hypothetical protein